MTVVAVVMTVIASLVAGAVWGVWWVDRQELKRYEVYLRDRDNK